MDRQHKSAVTQIGGMIGPMLDAGRPRGLGCPNLFRFWLPTYYSILKNNNK